MKWHVWITGYPCGVVEVEEGAMPMSAITVMAHAARELKAHHHGEIIEMNAACWQEGRYTDITSKFVRIRSSGQLENV